MEFCCVCYKNNYITKTTCKHIICLNCLMSLISPLPLVIENLVNLFLRQLKFKFKTNKTAIHAKTLLIKLLVILEVLK